MSVGRNEMGRETTCQINAYIPRGIYTHTKESTRRVRFILKRFSTQFSSQINCTNLARWKSSGVPWHAVLVPIMPRLMTSASGHNRLGYQTRGTPSTQREHRRVEPHLWRERFLIGSKSKLRSLFCGMGALLGGVRCVSVEGVEVAIASCGAVCFGGAGGKLTTNHADIQILCRCHGRVLRRLDNCIVTTYTKTCEMKL